MNKSDTATIVQSLTSNLQEGDILFLRIPALLFKKVADATNSWANHVGIVLKKEDRWVVAESVIPFAKYTPLEKFVARSQTGYISLHRLQQGLTPTQVQSLHSEAEKRMGTMYHLGFTFDSTRTYCSKLVYEIYLTATGLEIGIIQKFRDLLNEHPNPKRAKRFWMFYYFGFIPWERRMVSPAKQLADKKLITIFEGDAVREKKTRTV